jgi:hypothetical protein
VRIIRTLPDGRTVLELPRYFEFRKSATALALRGVEFVDVAGNTGPILVTVWVSPKSATSIPGTQILFAQPLLTKPGYQRVALLLPVAGLAEFLRQARRNLWSTRGDYDRTRMHQWCEPFEHRRPCHKCKSAPRGFNTSPSKSATSKPCVLRPPVPLNFA